eukprot:XP_006516147.3 PREDICTED: histone-lysine N-methyltransferase setd3 isoform X9 [Mus musculus]
MADQHPGWRADGRRGGAAPRRVRCGPMNGGGGPWAGPRGGRSRVGPRRRGCLWLPSSPSRPAAAATAAAAAWGLVEADGGVPAGVWRRRCAKTKRAVRKWNVAVLHPAQGKNGKSTRRSGLWLRKYGRSKKAEELFLWVPRKLLMTVESAKNSVLGPLYSQDRILQAMGNIALAFHLLCERASPNSFWQPYIQTLPSEYDTPLYFEEEEVRCLQSTQAIHDVFSQYKNTARQYAYFYKVIQTHPHANKLPLKESFTYEDYRWAVSSVMTRQNQIPTEDGSRVTLALIPLWDMCNHTNGLLSPGQAEATLALPCLPLIEAGCLFILKTENSNLRAL